MRKPYRVALWGPGIVGNAVLREIIRLPELELAGVLVYSDSKNNVDAGDLVGLPPTGVKTTKNREAFLALDAECILYTARDYGDWASDTDIIDILHAGKNVITSLPYHYPKARGPEVVEKLESACRRGNATLFGSGLFPGFIAEHMAMSLTVAIDDVQHIHIHETFESSGLASPEMVTAFGWGCPLEPDKENLAYHMSRNLYYPLVMQIGDMLGITFDKIVGACTSRVAPVDVQIPGLLIKAGTVGSLAYTWTGYIGDKPFLTLNPEWYMTQAMRPDDAISDECWIVTVEGRPSLQFKMDAKASFRDNTRFDEGGSFGGHYLTAIPMVRAIPSVIAAPPGIKLCEFPRQRWMPDMRMQGY